MNHKPPKRIAFLLGSGVSIPAGFPGVGKITERVLSGKNVSHHSSTYYIDETEKPDYMPAHLWNKYVPEITQFLSMLSEKIRKIDEKRDSVNYEFLFYLVNQLLLQEWGVFDNPLILPFWESIKPEVEKYVRENSYFSDPLNFLLECEHFIQDVVAALLRRPPDKLDYLNLFRECYQDPDFEQLDIFTLNHDLLMEEFFRINSIKFTDGFDDPLDNLRTWDPKNLKSNKNKARFIKLHGSIDWCGYSYHQNNTAVSFKAIAEGTSEFNVLNYKGHSLHPPDKRLFLTGTNNKLFNYNWDIWTALHYEFFKSLNKTNRMIIIGYGFGDTGINQRILEFLSKSPDTKMVIIDINASIMERNSFLRFKAEGWKKHGKLAFIESSIENLPWSQVKSLL